MTDNSGHWFVYTRTAGRISAAPVNWKGWLALIVTLGMTTTSGIFVSSLAVTWGPFAHLVALAMVILTGLLLIFRLVLAKGKAAH